MKRFFFILSFLISLTSVAFAKITLPEIIGDNMVLQQQTNARLWGWAEPESEITVTSSWGRTAVAKTDRTGRWSLTIQTPEASFTPQSISIKGDGSDITLQDVLIGEVWFASGQSNMDMPLRGYGVQPIEGAMQAIAYSSKYPGIRFATVPTRVSYTEQEHAPGLSWKKANPENAAEFSACAWFFAQSLSDILQVPVGIISCAYGGSSVEGWIPQSILASYPDIDIEKEKADESRNDWTRSSTMYNAMYAPVRGYNVKGIIWNQGESNVGKHDTYPQRQADMVGNWRKEWKLGELPFYYVELPSWEYGDGIDGTSCALFRECQHKATEILPNSGVVCTTDLVYDHEVKDIHASQKQPLGERLAFMAADRTYGIKGIHTQYPTFKEVLYEGDKATLRFNNRYGGFTPNLNLPGFEVAGEDRVFHPATAVEDWNSHTITVSAPEVKDIKAVRYCFRNFAPGRLHDMLGLPLVPFRTDSWE